MKQIKVLNPALYNKKSAVLVLHHVPEGLIKAPGVLTIGTIMPLHEADAEHGCTKYIDTVLLQYMYAIVYAVEKINNDSEILPGITLGYTIYDSCQKDTIAIARALNFIKIRDDPQNVTDANDDAVGTALCDHCDVVGVIGEMFSHISVQISHILQLLQIPQVSPFSTSDVLSDKSEFPYFMRTVPADTNQVAAMVSLINRFGWSYVSMLYVEGSYGENAARLFQLLVSKNNGLCIGLYRKLSLRKAGGTESEYDLVVDELLQHMNAKVVVLFLYQSQLSLLMKSVQRANITNHFIWILSDDSAYEPFTGYEDVMDGAIIVGLWTPLVDPELESWWQNRTLEDSENNRWIRESWEQAHNCSFTLDTCRVDETLTHRPLKRGVYHVTNAVYSFAYALDAVVRDHCVSVSGLMLRRCVTGPRLLAYLKNVSFESYPGHVIRFDENGNISPRYIILHFIRDDNASHRIVDVGTWESSKLVINETLLSWMRATGESPESVCSRPCPVRHYRIQLKQSCCWKCQPCRDNEYLINNATDCVPCSALYWPSERDAFLCEEIYLEYIRYSDMVAIAFSVVAACGIAAVAMVAAVFAKERKAQLIKACSKELSAVMLSGILLSFVLVLLMLAPPSAVTCTLMELGLPLSFTTIYAPLLIRTNRIYRIFTAGKNSNVRPPFVSSKSQLIFTFIITAIQLLSSIVTAIVVPPVPTKQQRSLSVPYVEMYCWLAPVELHSSAIFNLLLVVACTYYAVKTRKLPHNFNESRFIGMLVSAHGIGNFIQQKSKPKQKSKTTNIMQRFPSYTHVGKHMELMAAKLQDGYQSSRWRPSFKVAAKYEDGYQTSR
ncbi:PREDICTED: metabotropic glutamate receptor-like [Priapulus caudatus]|uniref:Metabotropic glutamate receptor-like n=1 Tax=Priapulus caudatus TaxID=37621 RepID=A0ABM1DZP8_PRICU|nr:PREDICTED: metabotropic glutamate receptor-like [Priapulus caudatus]